MGPLIPLFWSSGDVCPGFQSQGGFPRLRASCLHTTDSSDSPLVQHLPFPPIAVYTVWACIRHGWPGSSHMHQDLNHQRSGELLSGAWLSQTRYRLSYSAGPCRPTSCLLITSIVCVRQYENLSKFHFESRYVVQKIKSWHFRNHRVFPILVLNRG